MNKVVLIGRLTKDIELRYTQTNTAVGSTTIAVNRQKQENKEQETDFINLVIWGKQAETSSKYLKKGSQAAIDGRIKTRNYENNDGKKVYVVEVVAENIQFLDSKKENTQNQIEEPTEQELLDKAVNSNDPYKEFGQQIEFDDSSLPF